MNRNYDSAGIPGSAIMVDLVAFSSEYQKETINWIADFFGFHSGLITGENDLKEEDFIQAQESINEWTSERHSLYIILMSKKPVGFVHIGFRGDNVAWIEDIYVDKGYRGQGIASEAIAISEAIIKESKKYDAVCIDVVPRNLDALKLYYRLGYTNLSIITVRKELFDNKRDKKLDLLGFEFNY